MNPYLSILFILFLNTILCAQAIDETVLMEPKKVTFIVVDPSGFPVEEAMILASKPGEGDYEGKTDKNGELGLMLPKGASLSLNVSKNGYYTTSGEIWRG